MGAFAATLAGAWLVYMASARGLPVRRRPFARLWQWSGGLLLIVAALLWIDTAGTGAGLATALTELMLAWVALPYLAWWRQRAPIPERHEC